MKHADLDDHSRNLASSMAEAQVSLTAIQAILGHEAASTTARNLQLTFRLVTAIAKANCDHQKK